MLTPVPTVFVGSNGTVGGSSGLVPAPAPTDNVKFLRGDGTYAAAGGVTIGGAIGNSPTANGLLFADGSGNLKNNGPTWTGTQIQIGSSPNLYITSAGRIGWTNSASYFDLASSSWFPGNYSDCILYSPTGGVQTTTYRDISTTPVVHHSFNSTAAFAGGATAGYTAFRLNVTELGTPAGTRTILSLQRNGTTCYAVDATGALTLPTLADSAAPNGSLYLGSDHLDGASKPKLCRKDSSGTTTAIG